MKITRTEFLRMGGAAAAKTITINYTVTFVGGGTAVGTAVGTASPSPDLYRFGTSLRMRPCVLSVRM